ncbi:hypothetical protein BESB_065670 [Besnoitia besnoiti]|uniref:Uncharacterized protein n=1 Tax=Besnoitia besnoiti TaxID=94643 RepID=A0A2A9MBD9_BESBE|nr:hypothetical protein BESB_065670 [Besnoitia besnoiti]PFH34534.1 hypothetical protein BESB_065670 [Besnoitia besnoiti]
MLQVANATRQSVSLRAPDPLLDGRHNSCFTDGVLGRKKEQADRNEGEKSRAGSPESRCLNEDDAASPHVRHLQDGAEKTGVLREEKRAELNAGLNAFQESFYKFEPNKLRVNPGVPYCKPWQPLAELRYDVPSDDSFDHREPSTAADGFVSLSPAARFDNAAAGLERKGLGI